MMSEISINVHWQRTAPSLKPGNYDNAHDITFNPFCTMPGDAAPDWGGDASATNPEQAMAAALSSCHMMTFLALAAKADWPVATYQDQAEACLGKNETGHMAVTELKLAPRVTFDKGFQVANEEVNKMHHRAHRYCFIANSISAKMLIEPVA